MTVGLRRALGLVAALATAAILVVSLAPSVHAAGSVDTRQASLEDGLRDASAVWNGTHAFLFGGTFQDGPETWSDEVLRYDPASDTLETMSATLPGARTETTAVWTGQVAFIFGGYPCTQAVLGEPTACRDVLRYDPASDTLETMDARLPEGLRGHAAIWNGTHALLFGGQDSRAIHAYDPSADRFTTLAVQLPTKLWDAGAVWTGESAYLVGGRDSAAGARDEILSFDPDPGTVTTLGVSLPSPRNDTAAVWDGQALYTLGGGSDLVVLDQVVRIDPAAGLVDVREPTLPLPQSRAPAVWAGEQGLLFGGSGPSSARKTILAFQPGNEAPEPAFSHGTDGRTVTVDASATTDPEGEAVTYRWTWGDGETSQGGPQASHTYEQAQSYEVRLTARDAQGSAAHLTRTVSLVNQPPSAAFEVTHEGLTLQVDAGQSTDPDQTELSCTWAWGDASSTSQGCQTQHTYTTKGTYEVTLEVEDADGDTDTASREVEVTHGNLAPQASFAKHVRELTVRAMADGSKDVDGQITAYAWDWGDGTNASGKQANHTYDVPGTYEITLTVTDDQGDQASTTQALELDPSRDPPRASFTTERTRRTVTVDAAGSYVPSGEIVEYAWSWGDGSPTTYGLTSTHTYQHAGTYVIELTVVDDEDRQDATTRQETIPNRDPLARFTATTEALTLVVNATEATDAEGPLSTYHWSWGDGTEQTAGPVAAHTYAQSGGYEVTLTVTDADGATDAVYRIFSLGDRPENVLETLAQDNQSPTSNAGQGGAPAPRSNASQASQGGPAVAVEPAGNQAPGPALWGVLAGLMAALCIAPRRR